MKLHARIAPLNGGATTVSRIVTDSRIPTGIRAASALLVQDAAALDGIDTVGFAAVLVRNGTHAPEACILLPPDLGYVQAGDVVRVSRRSSELRVLFRTGSAHNVLFFTERCNSYCLMCSQPPREVDDRHLIDEIEETIKLISPATQRLGITGGEPTLQPDGFLRVLRTLKDYLPQTALFCLTNGRLFAYASYVSEISAVRHPDALFCIPLYSDVDSEHDFIVQARGAFDQTMRGLLNCGRFGLGAEVRVVIHALSYRRLGELAEFITRNLPFVKHVALMGLEITGFTRANLDALWVDPLDYQEQLARAVRSLARARIPVSIYNHQHCVLARELWSYAQHSISDWKNEYFPECRRCAAVGLCGGFFASSVIRSSRGINALSVETLAGSS